MDSPLSPSLAGVDASALAASPALRWSNSLADLGAVFSTPLRPTELPDPYWVGRSQQVADMLGIDPLWMGSEQALAALTGNLRLEGSRPLASVAAMAEASVQPEP